MYEKITLTVLTLFAIASSGQVSPIRAEVRNADFSDSRLSPILPLPSSYNDQHFTEMKVPRRSIFLLTTLSQTRSKHRQPREAIQKTKRCDTHLRKSRFSSPTTKENFVKRARASNVNAHVGTSRNIRYVSARNTKYSSENSATTTAWTKVKTLNENKTLLRALQDSLTDAQDSTMNVDSQKETKRCNKFVCYCQEENCVPKSSKISSSRMLGSSRRMKPGRMNNRRPTEYKNAKPILDASVLPPGSLRWYHEARHNPPILGLINSSPVRPHQEITHPAFFAPLLHGVPLVAPHIIGKDRKFINSAFPHTPLEGRPDFTVGDIYNQHRPIFHQDSQECRYSSQENRFDISTVSTTSAWSNIGTKLNLNEESSTTEFSTSNEMIAANHVDGLINPVTESNELKDIIKTTKISAAETFPKLSATFSTDHVASVTEEGMKDNLVSYSSNGTVGTDSADEEFPRFVTTPEISYVNAKTDSETRSDLNPYYSETTTMSATTDRSESSTDLFRETVLSWTNTPSLETENTFDQRLNDFELTSTESYEYTKPAPTEFYEYVETTERTYEPNENHDVWYSEENKLSDINKHIPIKKLMEQPMDEIGESTRDGLLGKSKSHTEMLLSPSYDGGSTTQNSPADGKFLYSNISYESNEDTSNLAATNAIRGNSWTSVLPFNRKVYEEETPYYESTTDRNFKEGIVNIPMESITETCLWRATLQDQLTTAQYTTHKKTNDDDKGDLEYTTENLVGITVSSKGLPFGDNSLLVSSIKRVINNFASSGDLMTAQDLDEDVLRTQDKSLLPEILQIPNLKDILSSPWIEDTIVAKVKGALSNVKDKDKSNFVNGMIRNALRRLLNSFRGLNHEKKLPPMTVEEHQFNHGQWRTKLVTLPPVHGENPGKLLKASECLRESIRDFLRIPAVASQADRQIVRNMIVQSLKNNLANKGEGEYDGVEMEDSVIYDTLNDELQTLRGSKDMSAIGALKKDDKNPKVESVNDKETISISQETSTCYEGEGDYKTEENIEEPISSNMKQFQKDTLVNGIETRTTSYQKVEKLDNNLSVLTACKSADLIKPGKLYEGEAVSLTANPLLEATTISSTDAEAFYEETENVLNSISTMEDVEVQQNNKENRNGESWEHTTTQQPSKIYQQLTEINQQSSKTYIPQETAGFTIEDAYTTEGTTRDVLDKTEQVGEQYNGTKEPWRSTVSANDNIQITSPWMNQSPETPNEESNVKIKTIIVQNEETPLISQSLERNTQESTSESSNCAFVRESSEISSSKPEILSFEKITKWCDEVTTSIDETTTQMSKQNSFTSKSLTANEVSNKTLVAAALAPNSMSLLTDDEPQISTTDFHNESHLEGKNNDETTQKNAMNPTEKCFHKYDEMDSTLMRATNDIDAPPINYYSPNNRILDYMKNYRVNNEGETTTATVSSMRKSSLDYARLSNEASLNKNTTAAINVKHEMKYTLNENAFSPSENTASDSISSTNNYENLKTEVTDSSSSADTNFLSSQQEKFHTEDVIKIHEITTEVQKTYAKTVYFQPRQFDPEDDSRTNSLAIAYESTGVASNNDNFNKNGNNNDDSNDPTNKKIDKINNVNAEANVNIVSVTGLPLEDASDTLQIFPSFSSEKSIEQLRKSQLYYINDGVKLPLEIRRLKDGTYALSISKNICEQIMKRKCCVPLQGHVVQSSRLDTRANDVEEDYQSITQTLSSTTTLRNTLQKLEEEAEEELNVYRLLNYRRKRDLIEDDSMAIVSMPVLDFAKKYNLSLDFDEKEMALKELKSNGKIRNFDDSLKQLVEESEYNQLKDKNLNNNSEGKKSGLQDEKEDKVGLQGSINTQNSDILRENVESLKEAGMQKSHTNASRLTKVETSKLRKLEDKDNGQQNVKVKEIINLSNQARNSISKETDISERETKFKNNEIKWGDFEIFVKKRGEIPEEIKLIKLKKNKENKQHMDNNKKNEFGISEINVFKKSGRPYRYQRNTNRSPNKGVEIVKKFLYWFKGLFVNTNES